MWISILNKLAGLFFSKIWSELEFIGPFQARLEVSAGICGITPKLRDWDRERDAKSENPGFGKETQNWKIRDPGLGLGLRFAGRGIPELNFGGLSRGLKNSGTRSGDWEFSWTWSRSLAPDDNRKLKNVNFNVTKLDSGLGSRAKFSRGKLT